MPARIVRIIVIVQCILFLGHWLLYETWTAFWFITDPRAAAALGAGLALLSVSFVPATLLAFRRNDFVVRLFYRLAAVWLGMANFLVWAACLCWVVYFGGRLFGMHPDRPILADVLFGLALLVSIYGFINAAWVRVRRITVLLPNLPPSWSGRVAALVSDTHLGHVHAYRFMRHIVGVLKGFTPDIVFIAGDMYDGTKVDADALVLPWKNFSPPLGAYFVAGNHEEFSDPGKYLDAITRAGIRVLNNEKVAVDGVEIVGVPYHDLVRPDHLRSILTVAGLDHGRTSILLAHAPSRAPDGLAIAEKAGVSLQLSGHTHCGQVPPFTWITRRIFQQYTYGLRRFGKLAIYTSSGAGTWGPPMRVGTRPEVVLIKFE